MSNFDGIPEIFLENSSRYIYHRAVFNSAAKTRMPESIKRRFYIVPASMDSVQPVLPISLQCLVTFFDLFGSRVTSRIALGRRFRVS